MNIVYLLIPLGIVLVVGAAWALIWAVDGGQYDGDLEAHAQVVLEPDPELCRNRDTRNDAC